MQTPPTLRERELHSQVIQLQQRYVADEDALAIILFVLHMDIFYLKKWFYLFAALGVWLSNCKDRK